MLFSFVRLLFRHSLWAYQWLEIFSVVVFQHLRRTHGRKQNESHNCQCRQFLFALKAASVSLMLFSLAKTLDAFPNIIRTGNMECASNRMSNANQNTHYCTRRNCFTFFGPLVSRSTKHVAVLVQVLAVLRVLELQLRIGWYTKQINRRLFALRSLVFHRTPQCRNCVIIFSPIYFHGLFGGCACVYNRYHAIFVLPFGGMCVIWMRSVGYEIIRTHCILATI